MDAHNFDKQLDQSDVKQALKDQNTVVIDLRPKNEFKDKHIKGSVSIPLFEKFEMFVAPFVENKKVVLILNEQDMEQAKKRLAEIKNSGVQGHLKGGIDNWDETYSKLDSISCEDFVKNKDLKQASLCDVRFPQEFGNGRLKGAQNINIVDIPKTTQIPLDKDKTHYLYCKTGMRGHMASSYLEGLGYKTVNIEGGYEGLSKTEIDIEKNL